jgi:hypothetical protein
MREFDKKEINDYTEILKKQKKKTTMDEFSAYEEFKQNVKKAMLDAEKEQKAQRESINAKIFAVMENKLKSSGRLSEGDFNQKAALMGD